jgi:hypothetical protein
LGRRPFPILCAFFGPFTPFARRSLLPTGRLARDAVPSEVEGLPDRAFTGFTRVLILNVFIFNVFIFMFSPTSSERRLMPFPKSSEMRDMFTLSGEAGYLLAMEPKAAFFGMPIFASSR